jgi:hypothetical protein
MWCIGVSATAATLTAAAYGAYGATTWCTCAWFVHTLVPLGAAVVFMCRCTCSMSDTPYACLLHMRATCNRNRLYSNNGWTHCCCTSNVVTLGLHCHHPQRVRGMEHICRIYGKRTFSGPGHIITAVVQASNVASSACYAFIETHRDTHQLQLRLSQRLLVPLHRCFTCCERQPLSMLWSTNKLA